MAVAIDRVTVRVPATVANLGAGFDVLAAAVGVHAVITLGPAESPDVTVTGPVVPQDASNLIYRSAAMVAERTGSRPVFSLEAHSPIPQRGGLGSSAAAIVGGVVAANRLLGNPLGPDELLSIAAELEGHPDNVAAALFGGVVVVARNGQRLHWTRLLPRLPLAVVLATPALEVDTAAARALLPREVSLEDAVFNLGHSSLLVAALSEGKATLLESVLDDRLHQPYRRHLVPGFDRVLGAARASGAYGAVLSGSGPSIAALAPPERADATAEAMGQAFRQAGLECRSVVTSIEPRGALGSEASESREGRAHGG